MGIIESDWSDCRFEYSVQSKTQDDNKPGLLSVPNDMHDHTAICKRNQILLKDSAEYVQNLKDYAGSEEVRIHLSGEPDLMVKGSSYATGLVFNVKKGAQYTFTRFTYQPLTGSRMSLELMAVIPFAM
jgi:hypothetical protein